MPLVQNVHVVSLGVPLARAAALIDGLGTDADQVWPRDRWAPMRVSGPLLLGARGAHGPVRYVVDRYTPGVDVHFRFEAPVGFDGGHGFTLVAEPGGCRLEHRVEMRTSGLARVAWPLVLGPLHDALAEDAGVTALRALGGAAPDRRWSPWVRFLRTLGG